MLTTPNLASNHPPHTHTANTHTHPNHAHVRTFTAARTRAGTPLAVERLGLKLVLFNGSQSKTGGGEKTARILSAADTQDLTTLKGRFFYATIRPPAAGPGPVAPLLPGPTPGPTPGPMPALVQSISEPPPLVGLEGEPVLFAINAAQTPEEDVQASGAVGAAGAMPDSDGSGDGDGGGGGTVVEPPGDCVGAESAARSALPDPISCKGTAERRQSGCVGSFRMHWHCPIFLTLDNKPCPHALQPGCGKGMARGSKVIAHMENASHSRRKDKPLQCPDCDRRFKNKQNLREHAQRWCKGQKEGQKEGHSQIPPPASETDVVLSN